MCHYLILYVTMRSYVCCYVILHVTMRSYVCHYVILHVTMIPYVHVTMCHTVFNNEVMCVTSYGHPCVTTSRHKSF